jgi:hypothetical protein
VQVVAEDVEVEMEQVAQVVAEQELQQRVLLALLTQAAAVVLAHMQQLHLQVLMVAQD